MVGRNLLPARDQEERRLDLDPETMARFLGTIRRQAIRDYRDGWQEPGYPDAVEFLWEAGLLHTDGAIGPPNRETPPGPLPRKLRPLVTRQRCVGTVVQATGPVWAVSGGCGKDRNDDHAQD
ncbi:MAG TPA: hypothetical protein VLA19_26565 [Herpetosiphonaceae bacterium]|nr:hypothetical protein [Herpetosiphonaceae bacterium]